ncbi:MAG: hypothetical protein Q9183_005256 [Haloplaca sp. 2 TL-2023]
MQEGERLTLGSEQCIPCDAPLDDDKRLTCTCPSKRTWRKEPSPPLSAEQLYQRRRHWLSSYARSLDESFRSLPTPEREYWDRRSKWHQKRYEREKEEYHEVLGLDAEILTDREAEDECETGNESEYLRLEVYRRRCQQTWQRYRKDHYKFDDLVKSPKEARGPDTMSRFTCLPPEIRNNVYQYVFQPTNCATYLRQWKPDCECQEGEEANLYTNSQPLDTRILAVSRQIHAEALDTLYSSRDFVVDVSGWDTLPRFVYDATGLVAPRPTSKIRRWHILVTFTNIKQEFGKAMHIIASVMKQCIRLEEVRFTWVTGSSYCGPSYWAEMEALTEAYGRLLAIFHSVRNVGQVIFSERLLDADARRLTKSFAVFDNVHMAKEDVRMALKASMESPSDG